MPAISATGTKVYTDTGYDFLDFDRETKTIAFAGSALATTTTLQYTDDAGADRVLYTVVTADLNGEPIVIGPLTAKVKLVNTGGSPSYTISCLGQFPA